jgi:EAL domain-containing protein (putative c-di-GMP-specific phosphodiesterase class I)
MLLIFVARGTKKPLKLLTLREACKKLRHTQQTKQLFLHVNICSLRPAREWTYIGVSEQEQAVFAVAAATRKVEVTSRVTS